MVVVATLAHRVTTERSSSCLPTQKPRKPMSEKVYVRDPEDDLLTDGDSVLYPRDNDTLTLLRTMAGSVMNTLGLGFSEAVYQAALETEMRMNNVTYVHEPILPIFYKGFQVGVLKPDLLVNHTFIVELKAVGPAYVRGKDQLRRYLVAAESLAPANTPNLTPAKPSYTGVLINFCQNPVTFQVVRAA